jgi:hypothetical protein
MEVIPKSSWPGWLAKHFPYVDSDQLGDAWKRLLSLWVALEEFYGDSSAKPLPVTFRPSQVSYWMKSGRRPLEPLKESDLEQFIDDWWKWWVYINPDWRVVGERQRLQIGGDGNWDVMRYPGVNGFLSIVAALKWWREVSSEETDEWRKAVGDVIWAISSMTSTFK